MSYTVDIICPVYNGEDCILKLDESIKKQKNVKINSVKYAVTEGKDNTEKILKDNNIDYIKVKKEEFSHSQTRENVAKTCDADIIVFITQDIIIESEEWLYNLTSPIANGECSASYSRQISKSKGIEKYTREKNYPENSYITSKEDVEKKGLRAFFFSDASSAISNETFKKLNYYDNKRLSISEDMYIAYKLIMNGYKIKYCSDSIIIHSHDFKFKELYKRYYDTGIFFKENSYLDEYGTNKTGGGMAVYVLKRILQEKDFGAFIRFWPDMIARFIGMKKGKFSTRNNKKDVSIVNNEQEEIRCSVAMATYNGEKYIKEQIDSILKNLSDKDELVISDDGSKDETVKIIKQYNDPRIKLVDGPRKGVKQNFANAIEQSKGKYIFLSDQDDIWMDNKLELVLKEFERSNASVVIHDAEVIDENLEVTISSFFEYRNSGKGIIKNIYKNTYIGCCMAFERDIKRYILPIPNNIEMHDQWIGIIAEAEGRGSVFLKEKLINYRRHSNNVSQMQHYGFFKMVKNRMNFITNYLKRRMEK